MSYQNRPSDDYARKIVELLEGQEVPDIETRGENAINASTARPAPPQGSGGGAVASSNRPADCGKSV